MQQQDSELRWEFERKKLEKKRFEEDFRALLDRYRMDMPVVPMLRVVDGDLQAASA